jgi:hypothetical protein
MRAIPRSEWQARVRSFCGDAPSAVLYDEEGGLLLDVSSGKRVPAAWPRVVSLHERRNAETGRPYLLLVREDGRQLVLADVGIAFAPSTAASGPIPDLPPVVCFRDLAGAEARLTHFLLDHPDEEPSPAHVSLFLFCLAVVDGARAVGFEVGPEEQRLERILGELEARRRAGGS